ncbi:hypothetical protein M3Y98_00156500 [Aphelenchoides besseyi]|nr:hypothetical protein M3Y98_00156500 [Aphelenchoides besseyi]KAI6199851.1 hypothetical protein M3Y96_00671100 [Aphelenchoides besseyi]
MIFGGLTCSRSIRLRPPSFINDPHSPFDRSLTMLDALPAEIRLKIASYVDILDIFTLLRVNRSWRKFVEKNAGILPKNHVSSLHLEQFHYTRFQFRIKTSEICDEKETKLTKYFFRTPNYLSVFLQMFRVKRSTYLRLIDRIGLEEELATAFRDAQVLSIRIDKGANNQNVSLINYLASLCETLPKLSSLIVEDASDNLNDDAHRMLTKLKTPRFIEARSAGSKSQLAIGDETLVHLGNSNVPLDCIVLSTRKSSFSLKAVRSFLENVKFDKHGLLELYYVNCTTTEFFNLLNELDIALESDAIRGIFNSFPLILRGKSVCVNIKYFSDSAAYDRAPYFA